MKLVRKITMHPKATFRLSALTLISGFTVPALIFAWNPFAVLGIDVLIVALTYFSVMLIIAAPIVSCERKFNDECDPRPLIDELRFQLTAPKNEISRFNISKDLASALFENGEYDEAMKVMNEMACDSGEWRSDMRLIYHSRILSFLCVSGNDEKCAEEAYSAAEAAYNEIPAEKRSENVESIYKSLNIDRLFISENYAECIEASEKYLPKSLRDDVRRRLIIALSASKTNLPQLAADNCKYIIENAKKHWFSRLAAEITY